MSTYEHEAYWPQIKELAQIGHYSEIDRLIANLADPKEQVALYRFAVRGLMFREWSNKSIVPIRLLGERSFLGALALGDKEEANVICFNMSANLADCWGDGFERGPEDFKQGLDYAERALVFRQELKKGPTPFSLAYWAKGIHLFLLGDHAGAETNFELSLKCAVEAAVAGGHATGVEARAPFGVLIAHGYLALARMALGRAEAREAFDAVIAAFLGMMELGEDAKADAELGVAQLAWVERYFSEHLKVP